MQLVGRFRENFLSEIAKQEAMYLEYLRDGVADFAAYKELVGYLAALRDVQALVDKSCKQIIKTLGED